MDKAAQDAFATDVAATAQMRSRTRRLVAAGLWTQAEPDRQRALAYATRHTLLATRNGAESITGGTEDFQRVSFLSVGATRSRAVAYVEVNYGLTAELGTGFLISPTLFVTNCHVIKNAEAARGAQVTFDRELDGRGFPRATTTYLLDPDRFALFSAVDELDFAIIALGRRQSGLATPAELGFCALSNRPDKHVLGMNTNIIEHPNGWTKMIAVRNNLLTGRTDHTLLYETDTEQGSSGSPVFSDDWEVIALHHWGQPHTDAAALPQAAGSVNEGIRISSIFNELSGRATALVGEQAALLREALSYNSDPQVTSGGPRLQPPRPAPAGAEALVPSFNRAETIMADDTAARTSASFTIPLEVTIRVPRWSGPNPALPIGGQLVGTSIRTLAPRLTPGSEALQLDQDYSNRPGYDAAFIPGLNVALPIAAQALAKQIAPLRDGEPKAAEGELRYEHFSLKLNKAKRIAIFTATNIDGATFLNVDRTTGKVNTSEGEVWFKDPRVSASFFLDQTFYSAWSTYFDRGHLTRRTDPTWGTAEEAEKANADTFHFTNCSPQHFRFNQSAKYWQGLERYVLENGVLAADTKRRLCVIQGPIFDDTIDLWADDVQIPSAFFKIVVWKADAGPKAVGLVVDQSKLLSEARHALGAPQDLASVDVNHWRVPVVGIEKKTKLDFGAAVRNADTIAQAAQPTVGEAGVLIASFDAIKL